MEDVTDFTPKITSSSNFRLRPSAWRVHRFEICTADLVCQVEVLRMKDSLFISVSNANNPTFGDLSFGAPTDGEALGTALVGQNGDSTALAKRLAAHLGQPVYVSSGYKFDRLTLPLVERGLIAEIKSRPECF